MIYNAVDPKILSVNITEIDSRCIRNIFKDAVAYCRIYRMKMVNHECFMQDAFVSYFIINETARHYVAESSTKDMQPGEKLNEKARY